MQIQAIPTNITRSDTPQTSLNDLINLNNNLPDDLLDAEVIDQVNFDASKVIHLFLLSKWAPIRITIFFQKFIKIFLVI